MDPAALRAAVGAQETRGVHGPQRGPVTVTQATEKGTVHTLAELAALREAAGGLPLHMDGARFANAVAALGCTAAEMVEGFDAVTFGATKNGAMGVEAVAFRDPGFSWEFELRRKRGAHLFSKHRFLSAQMAAYLADDLWLETARAANAACARLTAGLRAAGATLAYEPAANIAFARFPRAAHRRLHEAGARYYLWDGPLEGDPEEPVTCRLVTGWSTTGAEVDRFCEVLAG
jgi:threonine aldolase